VHNGTDVAMLPAVTRLMELKSKYSFLNQCYNDIMKLIIDLIPMKHNMPKDLYQSKKIVSGLRMNYEKINACEKIACYFRRSTRTTPNVCIAVGPFFCFVPFSFLIVVHLSHASNCYSSIAPLYVVYAGYRCV
jgi:hypothetical protein